MGIRASDEDVSAIAQKARDYVSLHSVASKQHAWKKACESVDKAVEDLRRAIVESAPYFANLTNLWRDSGVDSQLARIQGQARRLAKIEREKGSKLNTPLRPLLATILNAYHNAGKRGLGISTNPVTGEYYGPVLNAVKASLSLVDVPVDDWPRDATIRKAAREVARAGRQIAA